MTTTATPEACDRRGNEVSLYYSTGTSGAPVWVYHLGVVGDVTWNETDDEQEQTKRSPTNLVKQYILDRTDLSVEGTLVLDENYEGNRYLSSMRAGGPARDVLVLDGLISEVGVTGWRGYWKNSNRGVSGPESGPGRRSFKLVPAACAAVDVGPVRVTAADTISTYDPTQWSAASGMGQAFLDKLNSDLREWKDTYIKALQATGAQEVYVDVGKISALLGQEATEELALFTIETQSTQLLPESKHSVRRPRMQRNGFAGFDREPLLLALKDMGEPQIRSKSTFQGAAVPKENLRSVKNDKKVDE